MVIGNIWDIWTAFSKTQIHSDYNLVYVVFSHLQIRFLSFCHAYVSLRFVELSCIGLWSESNVVLWNITSGISVVARKDLYLLRFSPDCWTYSLVTITEMIFPTFDSSLSGSCSPQWRWKQLFSSRYDTRNIFLRCVKNITLIFQSSYCVLYLASRGMSVV